MRSIIANDAPDESECASLLAARDGKNWIVGRPLGRHPSGRERNVIFLRFTALSGKGVNITRKIFVVKNYGRNEKFRDLVIWKYFSKISGVVLSLFLVHFFRMENNIATTHQTQVLVSNNESHVTFNANSLNVAIWSSYKAS